MYDNTSCSDGFEYDEVDHVPMDNGRKAQLLQVIHLEPQGAGRELELARDLNQAAQCHALHRNRVPAPQRVQVDTVSIIACDHRETGETAFGSFRLPDYGEPGCTAQVQQFTLHPDTEQRFQQPANERTFFQN